MLKRIGQPPGICPVDIQRWHNPKSASADLWVVPRLTEDVEHTLGLIEVAGKQALRIGADTLDVVVPEAVGAVIRKRFSTEAPHSAD